MLFYLSPTLPTSPTPMLIKLIKSNATLFAESRSKKVLPDFNELQPDLTNLPTGK